METCDKCDTLPIRKQSPKAMDDRGKAATLKRQKRPADNASTIWLETVSIFLLRLTLLMNSVLLLERC